MSIPISLNSETGLLKSVILGHARDKSSVKYINNPKFAEAVRLGQEPTDEELHLEIEGFSDLLESSGVNVLRPRNIPECTQIFPRDIGFAIGDTFVVAAMYFENRKCEQGGISELISRMENVFVPPAEAVIEGGDVVLYGKYVFVGLGQRTNEAGLDFLVKHFPEREIIPLPIRVTEDAHTNVLHLDCAMQPVGEDSVIIYNQGFVKTPDALYDLFSEKKRISVTPSEMYDMFPNVFSLAADKVVIESGFSRLEKELHKRNIETLPIPYNKVSRLGGLLRCSTLPLFRQEP